MKKFLNSSIFILIFSVMSIVSCTISPDSGQYAIESDAFNGEISTYSGPGMFDAMNLFDAVTYYDKENMYSFSHALDEGENRDESIYVKFADFGEANISGTVRYALPSNPETMRIIHERYDSQYGVESELIRQAIERAVYLSGPLMTSQESNGSKRAYLLEIIMNQAQNGVFKVSTQEEKIVDVTTGKEKTIKVSKPIPCTDGADCVLGFKRSEPSPLNQYQIKLYNFTIKRIEYSGPVKEQIQKQQEMNMKMEELAIKAKQSQTESITTVENAKAQVAIENAEKDKLVAKAQAATAVAKEKLEQEKYEIEAILLSKKAEAEADRLKVQAGISPERAAYWKFRTDSIVSSNAAKASVPSIINASSSAEASKLQDAYGYERSIILIDQMNARKDRNEKND